MLKNGQVSQKCVLVQHITTQAGSCHVMSVVHTINIVLASVVDQWSALFFAQLNKNQP
jgi:hypothetical protein